MFHLEISKNRVNLKEREVLVSGASKSNLVQFAFSSDWEGLNRTAVFRAGEVSRSEVLSHTNQCHIPWEVLEMTGRILWAGVEGTDGEGLVLPTVWCALGCISPGAHPGDDEAQPPTPDVYSQLLAVANKAAETAKSVRDDADAGKFDGADGKDGVDGKDGAPGADGADAPQIDDEAVTGTNPWSSKRILDTLCPAFEVEGNPVTCTPVEGYPLSVQASWEPRQEGEGDPSPENIRPITGMDEVQVTRRGVNLYNADALVVINGDADIYGYGVPADDLIIGKTYTVSVNAPVFSFKISDYKSGYNSVAQDGIVDGKYTFVMARNSNIPNNLKQYIFISIAPALSDLVSNIEDAKSLQISICAGEDAMPYAPYQPGTTATLTLPETIYGGTVDTVTGAGVQEWAHIDSYNGEALPGEWISDRDVYAPDITPTIGAEIAYKLATPIPFQATGSQSLLALPGTNTIYTDADSVTVSGRADSLATIQAMQEQIAALTQHIAEGGTV